MIERYDPKSNYLNCRKNQISAILKMYKVPLLDLLFYKSLESSNEVFKSIIIEKKSRFLFKSNCMSENDLAKIGVKQVSRIFTNQADALNYIIDCLSQNKNPLIFINKNILEHGNIFPVRAHSVIIQSYCPENNTFIVLDDPDDIFKEYSFEYTELKNLIITDKNIVYYFYENIIDEDKCVNEIKSLYDKLILDKDFSAYDLIIEIINGFSNRNNNTSSYQFSDEEEEILDSLFHFFSFLSGSRVFFAKYLEFVKLLEGNIKDNLNEYIKNTNIISNLIRKSILQRKVPTERLVDLCLNLKSLDSFITTHVCPTRNLKV